jgi:hypothetical protein
MRAETAGRPTVQAEKYACQILSRGKDESAEELPLLSRLRGVRLTSIDVLGERMMTLASTPNRHSVTGTGTSRRPALLAGLVLAALAFAGTAEAAGQASVPTLGLVSGQAAQTAQAAVAQAPAVQVQPVNIAITIAVNSPGASPVIVQSNGNSAGAGAGNSSSTKQGSGKPQQSKGKSGSASGSGQSGGGSNGGGGPSQQAPQASQTVQGAGAQAPAVQSQPVNFAMPIAVLSPGASPVIVQTNGNSAAAIAANASSTAQDSAALQPTAGAAAPSPPPAQSGPLPPIVIPGIDFNALNDLLGPGSNFELVIPWPQLPALPWPFPGPKPAGAAEHKPKNDPVSPGRSVHGRGGADVGGWEPSSGLESGPGASSTFVQTPGNTAEPSLLPVLPLPRPALPAPASGGAGAGPGFVLGALATLALYLISLGLLLRRLGLASAPWRHQAYLAPLQRPG